MTLRVLGALAQVVALLVFTLGSWSLPHPRQVIAVVLVMALTSLLVLTGVALWRVGSRLTYAPTEGTRPLPRLRWPTGRRR